MNSHTGTTSGSIFLPWRRVALLLLFGLVPFLLLKAHALPDDKGKFTVSGHVKDAASGEMLAGVTILVKETRLGTVTNAYGFYSMSLQPGPYILKYSFVGYGTLEREVDLSSDKTLDISLEPVQSELGEVEIVGQRTDENVSSPEMGMVRLDVKTINRIPALLGEIDIIKVIQMLPGVQASSEGASGFSVRGGNPDQNLVILDEATVYNASHLMGFFSVFNNDVIRDVTLYKGDIPAAYGGRLASLLDIRMKDGNAKNFSATGSIGTVSSKLAVEGPLIRDRTTFIASGRRTYADLFLPFARNEDVRDNVLYFYDLNMKLTHMFSEKDRLFISGYLGRDIFKNQFARMGFGNQTASVRWNHLFSKKLFLNTSAVYSRYNYLIGTPPGNTTAFTWKSGMRDHSARFDFTWYPDTENTVKFGITSTFHEFYPGTVNGEGSESLLGEFKIPDQFALEHGIYLSNEQEWRRFSLKYGLRVSLFQNVGPGTYFKYDAAYQPLDSVVYRRGDFFNHYYGFEPRLALVCKLDDKSSVKGSYSHTKQYLSLAQNSTAGTPLDIWFPATPNVKPQVADQWAMGYFRNFMNNRVEASLEAYYKKLRDVFDFRNHAVLLMNEYLEGELRVGTGYAYGLEFLVRKNDGRVSGWLSYTYSRSMRRIPEISATAYPAPYDKPHAVSIVFNWDISRRWVASANWVYATGLPMTFPTGRAVLGNVVIPVYSNRNAYRIPDYHRLDFSLTLKGREKKGKRWMGEWNLSVYNAYNRKNAWSINFVQDSSDPNVTYAVKTYLFSVIPALTYNFHFN